LRSLLQTYHITQQARINASLLPTRANFSLKLWRYSLLFPTQQDAEPEVKLLSINRILADILTTISHEERPLSNFGTRCDGVLNFTCGSRSTITL